MLDALIPKSLPYPIRGAIFRAIRTAVAILIAGVAASIADGSIVANIHLWDSSYTPFVLLVLSSALAAFDKWLREHGLEDTADPAPPTPVIPVQPVVAAPPVLDNNDGKNSPPTDAANP